MKKPKKETFTSEACMAKYRAYGFITSTKADENKVSEAGFLIEGLRHLSGTEFMKIPAEKVVLLDVRTDYELSRLFDIKNILYCHYKEIGDHINDLPKDKLIVVADSTGLRSRETAHQLMEYGLANIANLAGGIVDWDRDGLPVTKDRSRILSGQCMCQLKTRQKSRPDH
jgi:rhodanese-related sulfurtransferase